MEVNIMNSIKGFYTLRLIVSNSRRQKKPNTPNNPNKGLNRQKLKVSTGNQGVLK